MMFTGTRMSDEERTACLAVVGEVADQKHIVCPHCGEKHETDMEDMSGLERGTIQRICGRCHRSFRVQYNLEAFFTR